MHPNPHVDGHCGASRHAEEEEAAIVCRAANVRHDYFQLVVVAVVVYRDIALDTVDDCYADFRFACG
jgi:hypothetical protein